MSTEREEVRQSVCCVPLSVSLLMELRPQSTASPKTEGPRAVTTSSRDWEGSSVLECVCAARCRDQGSDPQNLSQCQVGSPGTGKAETAFLRKLAF